MKRFTLRCTAALLVLAGTAPGLAQQAPPPPMQDGGGPAGRMGDRMAARGFASLSEAGRAIMRDAVKGDVDRKADHAAVKAARDRVLIVLDAERLDTLALKRAMDDERTIVNAGREKTQAAMQAAFARLSVADRKAFVADARALKDRMDARMQRWREMGGRRGDRHGNWGRRGIGGPDAGPDAPPPPGF